MKILELFGGSCTFTRLAPQYGFEAQSLDVRRRKGICEPTMRANIKHLKTGFYPFDKSFDIWVAFPPCDIWSYASGGHHLDKELKPKTEKAVKELYTYYHFLDLLEAANPAFFFIENPRALMRFEPRLQAYLQKRGGYTRELTLSSYGHATTKPTNIFTNFHPWRSKPLDNYGRGAKIEVRSDNLTKCQRQKTPDLLAHEILKELSSFYFGMKRTI